MPSPTLVLVTVAYVVACVLLARWTWRRLWRRGRDRWEQIVYDSGVRGFGRLAWIANALGAPLWKAWDRGAPLLSLAVAREVLSAALLGASLWLWAGYWWGRAMARTFGVRRTALPSPSEPQPPRHA